jgi:hypothetical protein
MEIHRDHPLMSHHRLSTVEVRLIAPAVDMAAAPRQQHLIPRQGVTEVHRLHQVATWHHLQAGIDELGRARNHVFPMSRFMQQLLRQKSRLLYPMSVSDNLIYDHLFI